MSDKLRLLISNDNRQNKHNVIVVLMFKVHNFFAETV